MTASNFVAKRLRLRWEEQGVKRKRVLLAIAPAVASLRLASAPPVLRHPPSLVSPRHNGSVWSEVVLRHYILVVYSVADVDLRGVGHGRARRVQVYLRRGEGRGGTV